MARPDREERVLILAPVGRDGELARRTLGRAGMRAEVCADMDSAGRRIRAGAGALLATQEALSGSALGQLFAALSRQPLWSDLPVIVLVSREPASTVRLRESFGDRANATFLERPVAAATLARAMEMALRARSRQYAVREHLLALARAQSAERRARAEAEDAVRIRDQFLASVAHDLKNPLGSIKGFAQLLQRRVERGVTDPAVLVANLARIDSMSNRVVRQIDELLDVARLQAGQPLPLALAPLDLVALARRVAGDSRAGASDHRVDVEAGAEEILGVWDPQRLERVLSNLIGNAIKYSPRGGTVVVRLVPSGDTVTITVQDSGIGIPSRDLPHIFEQFFRAGNAAGLAGTGLGLAGVRQIVEQHGGSIGIESEEGVGTRVTVRLPMVQEGRDGLRVAASE